jgi:hypothetical protein
MGPKSYRHTIGNKRANTVASKGATLKNVDISMHVLQDFTAL